MNIWKHLSGLNPSALWALVLMCIRNPMRVLPTIKATKECVAVCNLHYGKEHHRNTPANAFRHALWNYYVARACYRKNTSLEKVLLWAEQFTDWHEDFSKNPPLAREMDLHNNRVGRIVFKNKPQLNIDEVIAVFKSKAEASIKVKEMNDLETVDSHCLVHLKD